MACVKVQVFLLVPFHCLCNFDLNLFSQVYASVVMAIKALDVMNVSLIQDVKMASVLSHGSVIATSIGVEYYAISVNNNTK